MSLTKLLIKMVRKNRATVGDAPGHFRELRGQLTYLRKNERFVNLVFYCGGASAKSPDGVDTKKFKQVKLHREIVKEHSKLLKTLIDISETRDPSGTVSITIDPEVEPNTVEKLMEYLYLGQTTVGNHAVKASIDELCAILGMDFKMPDPSFSSEDSEEGEEEPKKSKKVMMVNPLAKGSKKPTAPSPADLEKMKEEAKTSKPVIDLAKVEDIKNKDTQKYLEKARRNSGIFSDASDVSSSAAAKRALNRKRSKTDSESAADDGKKAAEPAAVKKLSIVKNPAAVTTAPKDTPVPTKAAKKTNFTQKISSESEESDVEKGDKKPAVSDPAKPSTTENVKKRPLPSSDSEGEKAEKPAAPAKKPKMGPASMKNKPGPASAKAGPASSKSGPASSKAPTTKESTSAPDKPDPEKTGPEEPAKKPKMGPASKKNKPGPASAKAGPASSKAGPDCAKSGGGDSTSESTGSSKPKIGPASKTGSTPKPGPASRKIGSGPIKAPTPDLFPCGVCGSIFMSSEAKKKHMTNNHGGDSSDGESKKDHKKKIGPKSKKPSSTIKEERKKREERMSSSSSDDEAKKGSPKGSSPQKSKKSSSSVKPGLGLTSSEDEGGTSVSKKPKDGSSKPKPKIRLSMGSGASPKSAKPSPAGSKGTPKPGKSETSPAKPKPSSGTCYKCNYCDEIKDSPSNMKNHALNHFKEELLLQLPSGGVLVCPLCQAPSRDKITLLRHYAFGHKKVFDLCAPEDLMGKPVTGATPTPGRKGCEPGPGASSSKDSPKPPSKPGPSSSKPGPSSSKPGPSSSKPGPSSSKPGPSSSKKPGPASSKAGPGSSKPGPGSSKPGPGSSKKDTPSSEFIKPSSSDSSGDESKKKSIPNPFSKSKKVEASEKGDEAKHSDDKDKKPEESDTKKDDSSEVEKNGEATDKSEKTGSDEKDQSAANGEPGKSFLDAFNDALDESSSADEGNKNKGDDPASPEKKISEANSKLFSSDSETEIANVKEKAQEASKTFDELFGSEMANGEKNEDELDYEK